MPSGSQEPICLDTSDEEDLSQDAEKRRPAAISTATRPAQVLVVSSLKPAQSLAAQPPPRAEQSQQQTAAGASSQPTAVVQDDDEDPLGVPLSVIVSRPSSRSSTQPLPDVCAAVTGTPTAMPAQETRPRPAPPAVAASRPAALSLLSQPPPPPAPSSVQAAGAVICSVCHQDISSLSPDRRIGHEKYDRLRFGLPAHPKTNVAQAQAQNPGAFALDSPADVPACVAAAFALLVAAVAPIAPAPAPPAVAVASPPAPPSPVAAKAPAPAPAPIVAKAVRSPYFGGQNPAVPEQRKAADSSARRTTEQNNAKSKEVSAAEPPPRKKSKNDKKGKEGSADTEEDRGKEKKHKSKHKGAETSLVDSAGSTKRKKKGKGGKAGESDADVLAPQTADDASLMMATALSASLVDETAFPGPGPVRADTGKSQASGAQQPSAKLDMAGFEVSPQSQRKRRVDDDLDALFSPTQETEISPTPKFPVSSLAVASSAKASLWKAAASGPSGPTCPIEEPRAAVSAQQPAKAPVPKTATTEQTWGLQEEDPPLVPLPSAVPQQTADRPAVPTAVVEPIPDVRKDSADGTKGSQAVPKRREQNVPGVPTVSPCLSRRCLDELTALDKEYHERRQKILEAEISRVTSLVATTDLGERGLSPSLIQTPPKKVATSNKETNTDPFPPPVVRAQSFPRIESSALPPLPRSASSLGVHPAPSVPVSVPVPMPPPVVQPFRAEDLSNDELKRRATSYGMKTGGLTRNQLVARLNEVENKKFSASSDQSRRPP